MPGSDPINFISMSSQTMNGVTWQHYVSGSNLLYSAPSTCLVLIHQEFQGPFDRSQARQTASLSTGLSEQLNLGTCLSISWVKTQSSSWALVFRALICGYRGKALWKLWLLPAFTQINMIQSNIFFASWGVYCVRTPAAQRESIPVTPLRWISFPPLRLTASTGRDVKGLLHKSRRLNEKAGSQVYHGQVLLLLAAKGMAAAPGQGCEWGKGAQQSRQ